MNTHAHTAASYDLLGTKLSLPSLGSPRITRGELLARLSAGLQRPLTLISAPAGFGKTNLVVEWVEALTAQAGHSGSRSELPVNEIAWVSLDPGDNDPLRFWRYVLTAVQAFDPEAGATALTVLHAAQQPHFEAVLTALINALDPRPGKALLVLEDYHTITNPQIHTALAFLLDHLPPALHLVLLTRSDPPLPLARLRARNEVNELRAADLRFTAAEIGAFLQQAIPHPISPQTTGRLAARTEGWPAGLRLVALALQGRQQPEDQERFLDTFTGSHRPILEFLLADVLACQAEPIQEFLLETSLLDRLAASLCDAVTGRDDSAVLLDELESANLFLEPLDGAGQWYRFHGLFAEAMRYAARQRLGETRLRQLARNASRWYEEHLRLNEAVEFALQGQDFELAADLIGRVVVPRLVGNEYHTLLRWLQGLPADTLRPHPRLCLTYAQALLFSSKAVETVPVDRMRAPLDMAEQAWSAKDDQASLGELRAFRALVAWWQGDFARAFAQARLALDNLSQPGSAENDLGEADADWRALCLIFAGWEEYYAGRVDDALQLLSEARRLYQVSGNIYGLLDSAHALAEVHARRGEPAQAAELYQQAHSELERAPIDRVDRLRRQGRGLAGLASLAYERNDLEAAEQAASHALALGQELNNEELRVQASWVLARLERARGELEAARSRLNSLATQVKQPLFLHQVRAWQAWLALSAGDMALVRRWSAGSEVRAGLSGGQADQPEQGSIQEGNLRTSGRPAPTLPSLIQEQEALILARAQISLGQVEASLPSLESWLQDAQVHGRIRSELEIRLLIAEAQATLERLPQARQSLAQALNLSPSPNFMRVFLDEGEPLHSLISDFRIQVEKSGQDALVASLDRLLAAFSSEGQTFHAQGKSIAPDIISNQQSKFNAPFDPLSQQEERVLSLLVAGHSNPEIAQELVLSVNTVKTHVKSIYRKLNVNNRREARQSARRMKLLS